ncbi:MAG TPA: hypothetical protein VLH10_07020 [Yinghuangia sp.]|nr:hypothetical protein [Yinghuangia sp.]
MGAASFRDVRRQLFDAAERVLYGTAERADRQAPRESPPSSRADLQMPV